MYRIESENVQYVAGVILASFVAILGLIWFWDTPAWFRGLIVAVPFLFYVRYLTNQYTMLDPGAKQRTVPHRLFFRKVEDDPTLEAEVSMEDDHGKLTYFVTVRGSFGEQTVKLPGYEAYVTLVYQNVAKSVGLA